MNLLTSPQTWIGVLAVALAVFTVNAVRSGRMLGVLGVPALSRAEAAQRFWIVVAVRAVAVLLLALSAAAPELMLDILNGAND